jgi:hypothetical protein
MIEPGWGQHGDDFLLGEIGGIFAEDAADQTPAVGVETVGGITDHGITGLDPGGVEEIGFFDGSNGEATELDKTFGDDAGHFGGFSPGEDTVAGAEPLGHARDETGDLLFVDFRNADVIEEHNGITASGQDVVDVHGHEVLAGGFQQIVFKEEFELGADPVAAGHDDRLFVITEIVGGGEQAEGAQQLAFALGAAAEFADVADQFGRSFDINTRVFVG